MALLIENYVPYVKDNKGITSNLPVILSGTAATLAVGGTLTVTGATTLTGGVTSSVTTTVIQSALVGATVALTAAQSGFVFQNRSTSGTPSWTLPTNANGLTYTFTTANTTAGFTVTSAVIHFKTSATGTALTSTTTLTNTQATAVVGDAITIVSDGTAWWMTAQTGIFAAS